MSAVHALLWRVSEGQKLNLGALSSHTPSLCYERTGESDLISQGLGRYSAILFSSVFLFNSEAITHSIDQNRVP